MALEKELAAYARLKSSLMATDEGKFAVICGDDLIGTFVAYEDALTAGYKKCGVEPFLVRRITEVQPVNFFSRPLVTA